MRNGGDGGKYNEPGLPDFSGSMTQMLDRATVGVVELSGIFYSNDLVSGTIAASSGEIRNQPVIIKAAGSRSSAIFGASSTVMPASADMAVGIYLGQPA